MDFSNSVIMPREDFVELTTVAFDNSQIPVPTSERVASVVQTTAVFTALAATGAAVIWCGVKATDFLEEKRLSRDLRREAAKNKKTS